MKFFQRICRKKKTELKPGAILDQVISQSSSSANKCLLYKLANYKRGGDLIDAIQTGGQNAVELLIREQFGVFMYNNGKGQIINRAEFLRWKYRDNHEVVIPIEASLSSHDPLGKWIDHKACWQMQYRGSLGESLLHVLIICDTKIHTKLARILLRVFPCLALDVMEGEEYLGASALHLSIAYSNNELVADLVEAGALIDQRAIGSFFLPRDQQRDHPAKNTDYEGLAYMGEYPLAWAACCANESVYNLLVDVGADPDAQDSFGNMILHMVVVCDKLDMFGYALRHPKTPARNGIANDQGLTPLTLACKLGRAEVFREMLELSSREFWRYSNITCSGYPLNALDTLLPNGKTNWNSALFIILNGTKEEHLDMLDGGIIQRLLEEKWKTFAQKQFLKRLLILFVHLFFLSFSIYLRPANVDGRSVDEKNQNNEIASSDNNDDDADDGIDVQIILRYGCEMATIAGVLSYVIFQQGDEVKNQGLSAFLKQLPHAPAKAIFLVSNLMILACIPFRLMGDTDTEELLLVFAVPGSWFLLMFFAGAVRLTGPFVTMIYSMLTGDMFTFGIIYTIVLFGFSQAFFFLFKGHAQVHTTLFNNYASTWMALFMTTLGDYNYQELNQTSYPNLAKTVFVIFMIFVPILLLNMLIAMMGNTYAHVIEQSEKEWMKQWAKIVVTLERAVPQTDAQKYLEAYSIPLGNSDDSGLEQRGVMVIKSKSKTRAKQRKGAVNNWKRVGRVTLQALKKRGMTGEEMRRFMWGRASITSPTKVSKKKNKDPYNLCIESNSAMNAALDVMSFTQDILISPDLPKEKLVVTPTKQKGNKAKLAMLEKQNSATGFIMDPLTGKLTKTVAGKIIDPLRELVLISEQPSPKDVNYLSNITNLAKQALVLGEQQVIKTPLVPTTQVPPTTEIQFVPVSVAPKTIIKPPPGSEITNLQAMFAEQKVDPEKEKAFYKRLEALDDTEDSDGCIERPVLGKISLIRRAKSAISKTSTTALNEQDDRFPIFSFAWEPQIHTELGNGVDNQAFSTNDEIIQIEPTEIMPDQNHQNSNPKTEIDDDVVTAEDVHRKMTEFHLRHRQPDVDRRPKKINRTRRQKNKISPENTVDEMPEGKGNRGKSAPPKKSKKLIDNADADSNYDDADTSKDPLEPWSTREIQNINKILGNYK